jgi:hypothetical protein
VQKQYTNFGSHHNNHLLFPDLSSLLQWPEAASTKVYHCIIRIPVSRFRLHCKISRDASNGAGRMWLIKSCTAAVHYGQCQCINVPHCHIGWGTMLKAGRSRVRISMRSLDFSICLTLPVALWPWGRVSLLTEMSTRNLPGGNGRPERKGDLTAICEQIVKKMWPPRPVTGIKN